MALTPLPCACTIAGSDSSGGAGIQADLRTFTHFGVWGTSVVTAVTAQNTTGISGIWQMPPEAVSAQIMAVLADNKIRACKTGMLGSVACISAVADTLPRDIPLIVDPVMVATSGRRLLEEDAVEALINLLIPRAAIVTPNLAEAAILSGMDLIRTQEEMVQAGEVIRSLGAESVIVKGGHLKYPAEAVDVLVMQDEVITHTAPRLSHTAHGTGCVFSAALTAQVAKGIDLTAAFLRAKEYVHKGIEEAQYLLSGNCSVSHR